jgi:hypothetical protein
MDVRSAGTIMYWCEGSKRERDYRVEFVNSDPSMIMIFMKYLRGMGIDERRIRARLVIHQQDDVTACEKFWMKVTSLGKPNFLMTSVRNRSESKTPLPHGTITIRYNSISLLRQIKADIAVLAQELARM